MARRPSFTPTDYARFRDIEASELLVEFGDELSDLSGGDVAVEDRPESHETSTSASRASGSSS